MNDGCLRPGSPVEINSNMTDEKLIADTHFLGAGREHQVYLGAADDVLRKIGGALQGGR